MSHDPDGIYRTPGQLIAALLASKTWTHRTLAVILEMHETTINKIISGTRPVDAELALSLSELFDTPAERFLDLQRDYDLARARIEARPDPGRTNRAHLFGELPVADMIARGWLPGAESARDVPAVETALTKFFAAQSPGEIEVLPHAPKKTNMLTPATPAQLAWIYRVREIAEDMIVGRFSPAAVKATVPRLSGLLMAAEEARHVPRILAEAGIRFVIVETIGSAKIDGVAFWLNDFAPVIGMSLRYDRLDNFWFVLRHELEHIAAMHGRRATVLDADLEGERAGVGPTVAAEEREANIAAAEFCVPKTQMARFIERKQPFFYERDILGFARTLQIHPALVAGQLQRHLGRYDRFRNHLVKVRSIVAPSAMVDGWGDIAPVGL